jgi:hypothetical protein
MSRTDMRGTRVPMLGRRFGLLVVEAACGVTTMGRHPRWSCRCDCGRVIEAQGNNLRAGIKTSCGCEPQGKASVRAVVSAALPGGFFAGVTA